jgi:BatD DUF11 like domain
MKKLLFLLLVCQGLTAQVIFEAIADRTNVIGAERITVTFKVNAFADKENFIVPTFKGFKTVKGPSYTTKSFWEQGVRRFESSVSYMIHAEQAGVYTLPGASLTLEGTTYTTKPIKIKAESYVKNRDSLLAEFRKKVFIVGTLSTDTVYLNRPFEVSYKIYMGPFRNIKDINEVTAKYKDFKVKNLDITDTLFTKEIIDGDEYRVFCVSRLEVTPTRKGNLKIEPYALECKIDVLLSKEDEDPLQMLTDIITIYSEAIPVKVIKE